MTHGSRELPQRARADEDKARRREQIIDATRALFEQQEFVGVTVAAVARRAGLAKGTVYLYFRSKEELFLALLLDRLGPLFDALSVSFRAAADAGDLGRRMASDVAGRPLLLRLLTLMRAVLERNVAAETIRDFNKAVLQHMGAAAPEFEAALPGLAPGMGMALLRRIYGLIIGLHITTNPTEAVKEALVGAPELKVMTQDFETELSASIAALVRGTLRQPDMGGA
jgi:AcrR family transcriptional regulator